MEKIKDLSIINIFKSGFAPESSGRDAAIKHQQNKAKKNTETIITNIVIKDVVNRLSTGKPYIVEDFGTFGVRKRVARTVKNPQISKDIHIKPTKVLYFKADKKLKEKVEQ